MDAFRFLSICLRSPIFAAFIGLSAWAIHFGTVVCAQGQMVRPSMARPQAQARTDNFIIIAGTPELANTVAQAAEAQRHQLAVHWLGKPLPKWSQPCPITVLAGPQLGAGGSTTFTMHGGTVGSWRMNVQGTEERILDSVLPHEITHTVLASHFAPLGRPVPRWADEGACTTVEHQSERSKHDHFLVEFLSHGRGIPFADMFSLKDYPPDIMPLYAQGYSVSSFLIAQGGPQHFVKFLEDGMRTNDWAGAVDSYYQYPKLGKLQSAWNKWVGDGGGEVNRHTADALGLSTRSIAARNATTQPSIPASSVVTAGGIPNTPSGLPGFVVNGTAVNSMQNGSNPVGTAVTGPVIVASSNQPASPTPVGSGESYYQKQLKAHSSTSSSSPQPNSPVNISQRNAQDYSMSHQPPMQGNLQPGLLLTR